MGGGRNGAAGSARGVRVMTTPTTTWTRLIRRLGHDHNPLLRRADVIEGWLLPAALAAFLVLGLPTAGGAAWWARGDAIAARHAQLLSWHRVAAVLLAAAPGPLMSDNGANTWLVWTPARWMANGRPHAGTVPAAAGTRAGSAVPVWLDSAGKVRMPPLTQGQVWDRAMGAASIALAALAMVLAVLVLVTRRVLDHRRLAAWETGWRAVGPRWSGHR